MKASLMICLLMISWNSYAVSLTVIYDTGDTLPIDSYQQSNQDKGEGQPKLKLKPFMDRSHQFTPKFPITTPSMVPGIVDPVSMSIPYLQVPFFVMGNDTLSKQWLNRRKQELIKVGAIGLLVEASSLKEVNAIKRLGEGLHIYPAPGRDIAVQLGLKHYPVLISRKGIEQ